MLDNGRYFLLIPIIQMFTFLGNYYVVMNIVYREVDWTNVIYLRTLLLLIYIGNYYVVMTIVYREVDWTNVIYLRTLLLLIHITNMNVHYLRYL